MGPWLTDRIGLEKASQGSSPQRAAGEIVDWVLATATRTYGLTLTREVRNNFVLFCLYS